MSTETLPITPKVNGQYKLLDKLNPFPKGWFLICFSDEVAKGQILNRTFCGKEVVVFRTQSGEVSVLDAYCTHMGAHFGYGGTVVGETIKCPFHGFCFNTKGKCVTTAYGTKAPPKAKVQKWHAREFNGLILVFHDPHLDHVPNWEIPELDWTDWAPLIHHEFILKSHPQETAENSVDVGHLKEVHGYEEVKTLKPFNTDGPYMNARYFMLRPAGIMGKYGKSIRSEFEIFKWGLGYSAVGVNVLSYGLENRHFVFPTPIDGDRIYLRIAMTIKKIEKKSAINPFMVLFPREWVRQFIMKMALKEYIKDVEQDFKIWENKKYVNPPALAQGDGPIWQFRQWAAQFNY